MNKKLLSVILVMLAIMMPTKLWAQSTADDETDAEPYAVLSEDGLTVTFYYDDQKAARGGIDINNSYLGSNSPYGAATTAVFDASFANYQPTRTEYWFMKCSSLNSITGMENLNTANVTDMRYMFSGCSGLTSLDVSNFNTANVTWMNSMFDSCKSLTSLDVSSFNTVNVTSMSAMFQGCSALTSLDVSKFNTANVTDMSYMFYGCSGLTSLDVSNFNTANVTVMGYMFHGCSGLTSLDVSNFNTANVTNMRSMFDDCSGLTSHDVSNFNTANVTNMYNMFQGCSGLTSIDVSNFNTANVTSMGYMFSLCSGLTSLDVSNFNTANVTGMVYMFSGCSGLTSLDVSNFNTANVTGMYYMFQGCSGLTSLDVSKFNTANVTDMGDMFRGCSGLTSLDVSNFNTANVTSMSRMFDSCKSLTSIDVSNFNTANVTNMGLMFDGCSSLKTIYAGSEWSTAKVEIGNGMFLNCTNLVGGAGTAYDANHNDYTYAHIDGGPDNPGYFTDKNATPVINDNIEVVGNTDFSSEWWTAFSSNYEIPANYTLHMQFTNHSDKVNNWDNWTMLCTADSTRTPEYFALRADAYGWGDYYDASGLSYNWTDWDAFREAMDGAQVDFTVRRWGSEVKVTSIAKATSGLELTQEYTTSVDTAANIPINIFLTVEKAYLEIYKNSISLTPTEAPVGPEPYAVLSADGLTVTFYYDGQKSARGGVDISNSYTGGTPYHTATTLVFDASFADYRPTSTAYWFYNCSSLSNIIGMEYLNTQNVTNMMEMFYNCSSLTSLDLSNFKTQSVTDMGQMFSGCSGLTSLDVSKFNTANVTEMSYMFHGCSGLTSLDLSSFNTQNVTSMGSMFGRCSSLTSLDLSNFNTQNVTYMGYMFSDCSGMTSIYVGNDWSTEKVEGSGMMFYGCTKLVGGAGTTYDANHTDYTYAHIDGGTANPGYFTGKYVSTPTFDISYFNGDDLRMMTETDGAEIYYTMNGRMLQESDTDFGNGYLSSYSKWKVRGDNESHEVVRGSHNDSYCLKLASKKDDTFQSAQAYYTFDQFLKKGDYYTIRFKARSESGNGQMQFYCYNDTVANSLSAMDTLTIGKDWADYEATVKIANDSTNQFVLNFGALADTYYIDNVLFGPVISDTINQMRTRYVDPLRVERGVTIKAVAVKEGMMDSKPAVFDYFYDGWQHMMYVYDWGWKICEDAKGDPNVPLQRVQETQKSLDYMMADIYSKAEQEHIDDSEMMDYLSMTEAIIAELDNMRRGFTIDGVSYHAVDSTQVELISLLTYPYHYANAITVAKEVHYNDIDFQVTSVAQNAFADSELAAIVWNPAVALKYEDVAVINNPNLLVYVNEANLAPENIQNIVVNGVAKTIILENAANGNFYCPQAFTAEAISYTREFRQETMVGVSRGWEGIALPFDVQTITHENSGLISPFSRGDNNKHFWLRRLSSNGLVPADKMEANVPYIIAMPNSTEYPEEYNLPGRVTFSSANVTVPVTETRTLALADSTIMMASTMQRLARSSRYYALNVGEVRGQYLEGSVFERDYREIRPFEAYTIHNNANSPAPRFVPINQVGNGETTGIESLTPSLSKGEGAWYDLNGQKLQQKPTQKGVYIRNGRKVIIK